MAKKIICTICPLSCEIVLELGATNEVISLKGNKCERGKIYALKEHNSPERILTSTVRAKGCVHARLPVRSSKPIPKETLVSAMRLLDDIVVSAPIAVGQVIAKDLFGTGVDLISTRDL